MARPRCAVGSASDSRARGSVRYPILPLSFFLPLIQERQLSVTVESMCTWYGRLSLPRNNFNFIEIQTNMTIIQDINIGVGRGGGAGGQAPQLFGRGGGGNVPFAPPPPPNNPPTFSFNFYVKQEKSQMYQVEG